MKTYFVLLALFTLVTSHAIAQTPALPPAPPGVTLTPPAPPPAPLAPPAPPVPRQPINIKVDLTIAEEGGNSPAVRKTVSTVAGDGYSGSVRETTSGAPGVPAVPLNVDASPVILPNGKIRVGFNIQYSAGPSTPPADGRVRTDIRQSLTLVLENGKTLKVSEATDPLSDRHVSIEVTATILK